MSTQSTPPPGPPGPPPGRGTVQRRAPRRRPASGTHLRRRIVLAVAAVLAVLLVVVLGYAGYVYVQLNSIKKSAILDKVGGKEINLLIMGLDSRRDENGNALPPDIYNALHAGDQSSGGLNSNVLIFVHIPADGSRAIGISIPRDDYASLAGCPDGECHGKIKEAYGLAVDQKSRELAQQGVTGATAYQQARDAGRREEIQTVDDFLGVKINRFAEVTMVAFFQLAKVVQPITVCVKENTVDTYSGAKFRAGVQRIDAAQAVAFVRQRRDTNDASLNFTDLDRERRQQAFIISLLTQLKSANTLLNPSKVLGLVDVAKKNVVISDGLDPVSLANLADKLAGGGLHFFTLPVKSFGMVNGQDVNIVDPAKIRATVAGLLHPAVNAQSKPSPSASPTSVAPSALTVSVVNSSGVDGAAGGLMGELVQKGYRQGLVLTGASRQVGTTVKYAAGDEASARELQAAVGGAVTLVADPKLKPHELTVVIGTAVQPSSAATQAPVSGTGGGRAGPPVTALTEVNSGGIPCVK